MKMKNGNYNNVEDISTENLYKLLERAKKSQGDYVAQIQCIEKELKFRKRLKNTLPCCVNDWTDEQLKTQYSVTQQKNENSFLLKMIKNVADLRGLKLEGVK